MKIEFEIDKEELQKLITQKVTDEITKLIVEERYSYDKNIYQKMIKEAVKEVIYKDKQFVIDKVVEQSTKEVINKSVRRIINSIG